MFQSKASENLEIYDSSYYVTCSQLPRTCTRLLAVKAKFKLPEHDEQRDKERDIQFLPLAINEHKAGEKVDLHYRVRESNEYLRTDSGKGL